MADSEWPGLGRDTAAAQEKGGWFPETKSARLIKTCDDTWLPLGWSPVPHSLTLLLSSPRSCPWAYLSYRQRRFSILGGPILSTSVASLLGELLHEELALRWQQLLLDDTFTGGALAWVPGRTPVAGQLVYPAGGALDRLCILLCWAWSGMGRKVGA